MEIRACMKVSRDIHYLLWHAYDHFADNEDLLATDTLITMFDPYYLEAMKDCGDDILKYFEPWIAEFKEFFNLPNWRDIAKQNYDFNP